MPLRTKIQIAFTLLATAGAAALAACSGPQVCLPSWLLLVSLGAAYFAARGFGEKGFLVVIDPRIYLEKQFHGSNNAALSVNRQPGAMVSYIR